MNKKNKRREGFTLFELLVSVSIIGILTALAVVSFSAAQRKARDARRLEDIEAIRKAAEQYYSVSGYVYPSTTSDFVTAGVLSAWPLGPKGVGDTYRYSIGTSFCACVGVENRSSGNSSNTSCTFGTGATGPYYCVKSQQ